MKRVYFCIIEEAKVFLKISQTETIISNFSEIGSYGKVRVIFFDIPSATGSVDLYKPGGIGGFIKGIFGYENATCLQENLKTKNPTTFCFVKEKKLHTAIQALFFVKYVVLYDENLFWTMYSDTPYSSSQEEEKCKKALEELGKMSEDARYHMGLLAMEKIFSKLILHNCFDARAIAVKLCSIDDTMSSQSLIQQIANTFVKPLIAKHYSSGFWIPTFAISALWSGCCDLKKVSLPKGILEEKFNYILEHKTVQQQRLLVEQILDAEVLVVAFEIFSNETALQELLFDKINSSLETFLVPTKPLQLHKQTQHSLLKELIEKRLYTLFSQTEVINKASEWKTFIQSLSADPKQRFLEKMLVFDFENVHCKKACLDIATELAVWTANETFRDNFFLKLYCTVVKTKSIDHAVELFCLCNTHNSQTVNQQIVDHIFSTHSYATVLEKAITIPRLGVVFKERIVQENNKIPKDQVVKMLNSTRASKLNELFYSILDYVQKVYKKDTEQSLWLLTDFTDNHIFYALYPFVMSHSLGELLKNQVNSVLAVIRQCQVKRKNLVILPNIMKYLNHFTGNSSTFDFEITKCRERVNAFENSVGCFSNFVCRLYKRCAEFSDMTLQVEAAKQQIEERNICDLQFESKYGDVMQLSIRTASIIGTVSFSKILTELEATAEETLSSYGETTIVLKKALEAMVENWRALLSNSGTLRHIRNVLPCREVKKEVEAFAKLLLASQPDISRLIDDFQSCARSEGLHELYESLSEFLSMLKEFNTEIEVDKDVLAKLEELSKMHANSSTMVQDLVNLVDNIDNQLKQFPGVEKITSVISLLKNSKELISFLLICAEEDLPKMVDAVEDYAESILRVNVIKDLIDVYRIFKELIKHLQSKKMFNLLHLLNQLASQINLATDAKLNSVKSNVEGIKRIYAQLTNRTELTRETICNLASGAIFVVATEVTKDSELCIAIHALYEKRQYSFSALLELKSRGMLIKNGNAAHNEYSDSIDNFVLIIENLEQMKHLLKSLYEWGNGIALRYKREFSELSKIFETVTLLKDELQNWIKSVETVYDQNYWMTFYYSQELFQLGQKDKDLLSYIGVDSSSIKRHIDEEEEVFDEDEISFYPPASDILATASHFISCYAPLEYPNGVPVCDYEDLKLELEWKSFETAADFETVASFNCFNQQSVFNVLLSLHLTIEKQIPHCSQTLFCTSSTIWPEVFAFVCRCLFYSKMFPASTPRLFSIVNANELSYAVQSRLISYIQKGVLDSVSFKLAILCHNDEHNFPFTGKTIAGLNSKTIKKCISDLNKNYVFVNSAECGNSKTYFIQSEALRLNGNIVTLTIAGELTAATLISKLKSLIINPIDKVLHIDVNLVDNILLVNYFLLSMLCFKKFKSNYKMFSLPTQLSVYIEVANSLGDRLFQSIAHTSLATVISTSFSLDKIEFDLHPSSSTYLVCNYLRLYKNGTIDQSNTIGTITAAECKELVKEYYFNKCKSSTAYGYRSFISCMFYLLSCFKDNSFFTIETLQCLEQHNVRKHMLDSMLETALEFSSRSVQSLKTCQADVVESEELLKNRLENMISWERSNHSIVAFHKHGSITAIGREVSNFPKAIKSLYASQGSKIEDFSSLDSAQIATTLFLIVDASTHTKAEASKLNYCLTADNFLKMILIWIRIQSNIPVVICGETGCGKTSLIRYLAVASGATMIVENIHAAVSHADIVSKVQQANDSIKSSKGDYWLFLDEVNTCNCLGLVSEIVCNHSLEGKPLHKNLKVLCAVNPYRLKKQVADYASVSTVGLKKQEQSSTKLAYTVNPLPESMLEFLWDFGYLSEQEEKSYILQMISKVFPEKYRSMITNVISMSQVFVRQIEDPSSVSLRDVARFCALKTFFHKNAQHKYSSDVDVTSTILALSQCYYMRLGSENSRQEYIRRVSELLNLQKHLFMKVLEEEQDKFLNEMERPSGIALNTALRENVFSLIICILNKIPVFLVGRPGSTKTLSMQLISSNFRGRDSSSRLLRTFPRVCLVSYQGSESSTSEGILNVFSKAKSMLHNRHEPQYQDQEQLVPVVFMDEIGLAEISKHNPLKVLHSLLEEEIDRVAVVGVSNWRLDASKMNRALYIARYDPSINDLEKTAQEICASILNTKKHDNQITKLVAETFYKYQQQLKQSSTPNFHGLRDFYSLVKSIFRKTKDASLQEKERIVFEAIERNFSGLPRNGFLDIALPKFVQSAQLQSNAMTSTELILSNLEEKDARHLLIVSSGDSGVWILQKDLLNIDTEETGDVVVLHGSKFEQDVAMDNYSYQILSRIILYMEAGKTVILSNLDMIYGSLYDMLNQNYSLVGNKKNCRIALGSNSNPMCFVDDRFRCIVIVQDTVVNTLDPPFLNRFEKHILNYDAYIDKSTLHNLKEWIVQIISRNGKRIVIDPSCIIPSLNENNLKALIMRHKDKEDVLNRCKRDLVSMMTNYGILAFRTSQVFDNELYDHFYTKSGDITTFLKKRVEVGPIREVIYTFSNINENYEQMLTFWKPRILKVNTFKSERDILQELNSFENSDDSLLLVLLRAEEDSNHLCHIKFLLDEKLKDSSKGVLIVISLKFSVLDDTGSLQFPQEQAYHLSLLSDWNQNVIDAMNKSRNYQSLDELRTTLEISDLFNFITQQDSVVKETIQSMLPECYLELKFDCEDDEMKQQYISEQIEIISTSSIVNEAIESLVRDYIKTASIDWRQKLLHDNSIAIFSSSVKSAIQVIIQKVIKKKLVEILWNCERYCIIRPKVDSMEEWWKKQLQSINFSSPMQDSRIKLKDKVRLPFYSEVYPMLNNIGEELRSNAESIIGEEEMLQRMPKLFELLELQLAETAKDLPLYFIRSTAAINSFIANFMYEEKHSSASIEVITKLFTKLPDESLSHCIFTLYCCTELINQTIALTPIIQAQPFIMEQVSGKNWFEIHTSLFQHLMEVIKPSEDNFKNIFNNSLDQWISTANLCLLNYSSFNNLNRIYLNLWTDVANYCQIFEQSKNSLFFKLVTTLIYDSAMECYTQFKKATDVELAKSNGHNIYLDTIRARQLRMKSFVYSRLIEFGEIEVIYTILQEIGTNEEMVPFCNQLVHTILADIFPTADKLPSETDNQQKLVAHLNQILQGKLNSPLATLICDVFFKMLHSSMDTDLEANFTSKCIDLLRKNAQTNSIDFIFSFAFIKVQLYLYAQMLPTLNSNAEIITIMNTVLECQETHLDSLRLYLLKCLKTNLQTLQQLDQLIPSYDHAIRTWYNRLKPTEDNTNKLQYNIFFSNPQYNFSQNLLFGPKKSSKDEQDMFKQYQANRSLQHGLLDVFASYYIENRFTQQMKNFAELLKAFVTPEVWYMIQCYCNNFFNDTYLISMLQSPEQIHQLAFLLKLLNWHVCRLQDNHFSLLVNNQHINSFVVGMGDELSAIYYILNTSNNRHAAYKCGCGYLYMIGDCTNPEFERPCPHCNKTLGGKNHKLTQGQKVTDLTQQGYIVVEDIPTFFTCRTLTPVAFRVIDILMHGLLLVCQSSKLLNRSFLQDRFAPNGLSLYLRKKFETSWNALGSSILQLSTEQLTSLLCEACNKLYTSHVFNSVTVLATENDRVSFENAISYQIIDLLFSKHQETIAAFNSNVVKIGKELSEEKVNNFMCKIDETDQISDNQQLWMYNLAREIKLYSTKDLACQFQSSTDVRSKYIFLTYYYENETKLKLLDSLIHILNWTTFLLDKCCGKIKRVAAQEQSVKIFLENSLNGVEQEIARNLFVKFQNAWRRIGQHIGRYKCKPLPVVESFEEDTKLCVFLLDTKESACNYMFAALQHLSGIQTTFITQARKNLATYKKNILFEGISSISIQQAQQKDIISINNEESCLHSVAQYTNNLQYGKGKQVHFDFEKIEFQLARELLLEKPILVFEEDKFYCMVYENEFIAAHQNVIGDFMTKIPQSALSQEKAHQLKLQIKTMNAKERKDLCTSLEVVMFFANKMSGHKTVDQIICNAKALKFTQSSLLVVNNLLQNISVEHMLHVYEIVEDGTIEDVFQIISNNFKQPLDDTMKNTFKENLRRHGLTLLDMEIVMKRFVKRFIDGQPDMENRINDPIIYFLIDCAPLWPNRRVPTEEQTSSTSTSPTDPAMVLDELFQVKHALSLYYYCKEHNQKVATVDGILLQQFKRSIEPSAGTAKIDASQKVKINTKKGFN